MLDAGYLMLQVTGYEFPLSPLGLPGQRLGGEGWGEG